MQAVVFDHPGDEEVLRVAEVEDPTPPAAGEVTIAIAAAGVNRADLLQRRGLYPQPAGESPILGLECAGSILAVGQGVDRFEPGDRVMALLAGGGYAERVTVPACCVLRVPDCLSDAEGAAVPETFVTAYLNVFELGRLVPGEVALIHGGSGGVGTAAIQLVRAAGARALVTAGTDERCQSCRELGAEAAFNYRTTDLVEACADATADRGVNVVLDCVGGLYLDAHMRLLAVGGRLVVIGLMGGSKAQLDMARLLARRLYILGSTLRSRSPAEKGESIAGLWDRFGHDIEIAAISPVVDRVLSMDRAAEAHRVLAGGTVFGKIVLAW